VFYADQYARDLAAVRVNLDAIAHRVQRLKNWLHAAEHRKALRQTFWLGKYEPNDEPLSSQELCRR